MCAHDHVGMYAHVQRGQRTSSNIVTQVPPTFFFSFLKKLYLFWGGERVPRRCECLKGPEDGTGLCGAGVAGSYKLPDVDDGHLIWVLWKRGELF